jgi:hypothetical protein
MRSIAAAGSGRRDGAAPAVAPRGRPETNLGDPLNTSPMIEILKTRETAEIISFVCLDFPKKDASVGYPIKPKPTQVKRTKLILFVF